MAITDGIQQIGADFGHGGTGSSDKLKMFLVKFSGQVLTAFDRANVTQNRHTIRSIENGKAASFPVLGRTSARKLEAGESLDTGRKRIEGTQKIINIDGLLVSDVLIADIEDAMNHFDVRAEYTKQLGEALAISYDCSVLAEIAKACNLTGGAEQNLNGLGKPVTFKVKEEGKATLLGKPEELGKLMMQYLAKAQAKLNTQYVPQGERYFYCEPEVYAAISASLLPTNANFASLANAETGVLKNIFGFEIIQVPHLSNGGIGHVFPSNGTGTGSTVVGKDNVLGLFMHRSAIGTVKLKDLAIEHARRAELQADMIVAKYSMGHGLLRPEALGCLVANGA